MLKMNRYAAPAAALALAALIVGCPGNNPATNTTSSDGKTSVNKGSPLPTKPSGSPSSFATLPPGGGGNPSANPTPSDGKTTLPSGSPVPLASGTPAPNGSSSPATGGGTPTPGPTGTPNGPMMDPQTSSDGYVQVERLARPAINEGLIIDNRLLNTWNAVGPDVDADATKAKPLLDQASVVLKALGNKDEDVTTLVTQLLPDVMRIDTLKGSGYNVTNLSTTKKIPIGGRLIKDDVMDLTLALIVPGGAPAGAALPGLESDGVSYEANHKAVLADFPYLAEPN